MPEAELPYQGGTKLPPANQPASGAFSEGPITKSLETQWNEVLTGLRDSATVLTVIEGVGHEYYIRECNVAGEIIDLEPFEVKYLDGSKKSMTIVSIKGDVCSERILVPSEIQFNAGDSVRMEGARVVFINGGVDFIEGSNPERSLDRLRRLKDLLSKEEPAIAIGIVRNGEIVYADAEARGQLDDLLESAKASRRDWWREAIEGQ